MSSEKRRYSGLSAYLKEDKTVQQLKDADGNIDVDASVASLAEARKKNKQLTYASGVMFIFCCLLIAANFGMTVLAAVLSKDTVIDTETGFVTAKGESGAIMKTTEATVTEYQNPGNMKVDQLSKLKNVATADGSASFNVKGFSKPSEDGDVMLLVEGGILKYDADGLVDATGFARDVLANGGGGRRRRLSNKNCRPVVIYGVGQTTDCQKKCTSTTGCIGYTHEGHPLDTCTLDFPACCGDWKLPFFYKHVGLCNGECQATPDCEGTHNYTWDSETETCTLNFPDCKETDQDKWTTKSVAGDDKAKEKAKDKSKKKKEEKKEE